VGRSTNEQESNFLAGQSVEWKNKIRSLPLGETQGQRGTGQIREKVEEDENGIGIAEARSLSSEAGEKSGIGNKQGGS
jgi:hypothetical protein